MTARIRVEITAEHVGNARPDRDAWAEPVEAALSAMAGVSVGIDGDLDEGNIATIGNRDSPTTLVVELPAEANAWLNARWAGTSQGEPFAFDLELSDWLFDLVGASTRVDG